MDFHGLITRLNKADLPPGASPELANVFFAKGRTGTLGPRRGRKLVNSKAYREAITGRACFNRPNGTVRQVIALNNGDIIEGVQASQTGPTLYLTGDTASGKAQNTGITLTYPTTKATQLTTFSDASTFDPDLSLMASWGVSLGATGSGDWSDAKQLNLSFGINENGTGRILNTLQWTMTFEGAWSLSGLTPAAVHAGRDTITGGYFEIEWPNGWPTGAGAGDDFSMSSILMG